MHNSAKVFSLNWASHIPSVRLLHAARPGARPIPGVQNPQYPKEYSIFVGDLAHNVSNSDVVAVFPNLVLGLRNDHEPRFIHPFLSCKSAKIMLDPVTRMSRGYVLWLRQVRFEWLYAPKISSPCVVDSRTMPTSSAR